MKKPVDNLTLSAEDGEALMARVGGQGQVILTAVEPAPIPPAVLASGRVQMVREGTLEACG